MSEIMFTRSNSIGSKLIMGVTGESVSHVALRIGAFVLHSRMIDSGVTINLYTDFVREAEIVHRIPYLVSTRKLSEKKYKGIHYDVGALLYIGVRILLREIGISLPKKNLWQSTGMYMCTEFLTDIVSGKEDSMITPYQLYTKMKEVSK